LPADIGAEAAQPASLARRLMSHLLPGRSAPARTDLVASGSEEGGSHPALPLTSHDEPGVYATGPMADSLFPAARPIEPVLSYEQASPDQVVPGAASPTATHDRLILPGGIGLIIYEAHAGAMAFDWMRWGGGSASPFGATIDVRALRRRGAGRRLAGQRCAVPLTRFSVPVRNGSLWSHRWIEPVAGGITCAAGVWSLDRNAGSMFAMVTDDAGQMSGGPLLLSESAILLWLRAPLDEALAAIADHPAGAERATG